MGEGDSDVAGHRLERGEITLDFFLSSLGDVEKKHGQSAPRLKEILWG